MTPFLSKMPKNVAPPPSHTQAMQTPSSAPAPAAATKKKEELGKEDPLDSLMARVEKTLQHLALLEMEEAKAQKKDARGGGAGGPPGQAQATLQLTPVPQGNKTRIYPLDELIRKQQTLDKDKVYIKWEFPSFTKKKGKQDFD